MPRYRCLIRGDNFVTKDADTKISRDMGFFTTRWVWAKDHHEAETKALAKLKKDTFLKDSAKKGISDVTFEEIEISKIPLWGIFSTRAHNNPFKFGKGCVWYEMEEEDKNEM